MAWYSNWTRACRLAITPPSGATSALSYFPVLVTAACLPTELTNGTYGRSDGGDLAFALDASGSIGAQIPCEVVSASFGGSPAAEIWVQVAASNGIAAYPATSYIWVLYGNSSQSAQPGAGTTYGSQAVWIEGGTQSYRAVYHFGSNSLSLVDSTANNNSGANHGASLGTGQVGGGASYNGSSYISLGSPSSLTNLSAGDFSVELWVNQTIDSSERWIDKRPSTNGWYIQQYSFTGSAKAVDFYIGCGGNGNRVVTVNNVMTPGTMTYVAGVYTSSTKSNAVYANGALSGNNGSYTSSGYTPGSDTGNEMDLGRQSGGASYFTGTHDEIRISAVARSASWIAASYGNQSSPGGFTSVSGSPGPIGYWVNGSIVTGKAALSGTIGATVPTFSASGAVPLKKVTAAGTIGETVPTFSAAGPVPLKKLSASGTIGMSIPSAAVNGGIPLRRPVLYGAIGDIAPVFNATGTIRLKVPGPAGSLTITIPTRAALGAIGLPRVRPAGSIVAANPKAAHGAIALPRVQLAAGTIGPNTGGASCAAVYQQMLAQ